MKLPIVAFYKYRSGAKSLVCQMIQLHFKVLASKGSENNIYRKDSTLDKSLAIC